MVKTSSKHNFNLYALNVILGLEKASPELLKWSKAFKQFGFSCFAIERDFLASKQGRIKPEIILCSQVLNSTLLFESTQADISFKTTTKSKSGYSQIDRYRAVDRQYLNEIAAIPKPSLTFLDVVFIVSKENLQGYVNHFSENGIAFPILLFDYNIEKKYYTLQKLANRFSSRIIDNFFSEEMTFKVIPKYIQVDIGNLNNSKPKYFELLGLNLLSILYKKKFSETFSTSELAKNVLDENIWQVLSIENKRCAERMAGSFIEQLVRKVPIINEKYFKEEKNRSTYRIILADKLKEKTLQKVNRRIIQFAKEEADPNANIQLTLSFKS